MLRPLRMVRGSLLIQSFYYVVPDMDDYPLQKPHTQN